MGFNDNEEDKLNTMDYLQFIVAAPFMVFGFVFSALFIGSIIPLLWAYKVLGKND